MLRLRRGRVGKGRKNGMSVEGRGKKQKSKGHEGRRENVRTVAVDPGSNSQC